MKVYIKTLGCEKNTVDSENAAHLLENAGCVLVDNSDEADVFIVNTCGFIKDAKKQSIETIFDLSREKDNGKRLIVAGCLSQRYTKELSKEMPEVDAFLGVNDYDRLTDVVLGSDNERCIANPAESRYKEIGERSLLTTPWTRSIKIAEGCSNICSYCIIPKIRGKYRSRQEEDILKEAEQLAKQGCKELVVIAQDVTFYGRDLGIKNALPQLLNRLAKIDGIEWIRLMYCYEDEITDELIAEIKNNDKICKYIDIPLQHCSSRVLKEMNRKSTAESIKGTITELRKQIPEITIRTTFIVGFPGETKEDFTELLEFVKDTKFQRLGVFTYSKEEGTKAASMSNQIRENTKESRRNAIMEEQRRISLDNNSKFIGKTLKVLVEEVEEDGTYIGRSEMDAPDIDNTVIFTGRKGIKPGTFVNVHIEDAFDYDLSGKAAE